MAVQYLKCTWLLLLTADFSPSVCKSLAILSPPVIPLFEWMASVLILLHMAFIFIPFCVLSCLLTVVCFGRVYICKSWWINNIYGDNRSWRNEANTGRNEKPRRSITGKFVTWCCEELKIKMEKLEPSMQWRTYIFLCRSWELVYLYGYERNPRNITNWSLFFLARTVML